MKRILSVLSFVFLVLGVSQAQALIEARVGYSALTSSTNLDGLYAGSETVPGVVPQYGLVTDVIVSPPLFSFGVGLRQENLGLAAGDALRFETSMSRTSLLFNYRLIDTLMYLGPIASFGLSHKMNMKIKENGTEISNFGSSKSTSYSVGVEGGVKLIGLLLGAELGYQSLKFADADDTVGAGATQDIDLSGTYFRVSIGFGI